MRKTSKVDKKNECNKKTIIIGKSYATDRYIRKAFKGKAEKKRQEILSQRTRQ